MRAIDDFSLNYWFDGYIENPALYPSDETQDREVNGVAIQLLTKRCPESGQVLDAKWTLANEADGSVAMDTEFVRACHRLVMDIMQ